MLIPQETIEKKINEIIEYGQQIREEQVKLYWRESLEDLLSWYNKELIEEIEEMEKDHAFKVYKVEDIAKESYNQALFDIISKLKE